MKTSNILLTCALLLGFAAMIKYSYGLKKEFLAANRTGLNEYRTAKRFDNYKKFKLPAIHSINVNGAVNISVEQGDTAAVWVRNGSNEMVKLNNIGSSLDIELTPKGRENDYWNWESSVVIVTPKISSIQTKGFVKFPDKKDTSVWSPMDYELNIKGFKLDSFKLVVAPHCNVSMDKNSIERFNATVRTNGRLKVQESNEIDRFSLNAKDKSKIELQNKFNHLDQNIDSTAVITMLGISISKFR
jgi:hypothetical protein